MDRFTLIVVPCAAYLLPDTYVKLKQTTATVLWTGCFAQSFSAVHTPFGSRRAVDGLTLDYHQRPAGKVTVSGEHPLIEGLGDLLEKQPVTLPADESFRYAGEAGDVEVLLRCGQEPLLSIRRAGRFVHIHGHLLAGLCHDPNRKPPRPVGGSRDSSANDVDPWGPYRSDHPQNHVGRLLVRNVLDHAHVAYRVPAPAPRTSTPYLGDHMERASISANIAYNNTPVPEQLTVRLPYRPRGHEVRPVSGGHEAEIAIPPFSYVALQPVR
jgi:hypothetical protein